MTVWWNLFQAPTARRDNRRNKLRSPSCGGGATASATGGATVAVGGEKQPDGLKQSFAKSSQNCTLWHEIVGKKINFEWVIDWSWMIFPAESLVSARKIQSFFLPEQEERFPSVGPNKQSSRRLPAPSRFPFVPRSYWQGWSDIWKVFKLYLFREYVRSLSLLNPAELGWKALDVGLKEEEFVWKKRKAGGKSGDRGQNGAAVQVDRMSRQSKV